MTLKNTFRRMVTFLIAALLIASLPLSALATNITQGNHIINNDLVDNVPGYVINPGKLTLGTVYYVVKEAEKTEEAVAEEEERGYFTVDGKWSQTGKDGTLTVTALARKSRLKITHWGIEGLLDAKVQTLVFVTDQAESTLDLKELKSNNVVCCTLRHTGAETSQEIK